MSRCQWRTRRTMIALEPRSAVAGKGRLWAGVGAYLNSHAGTLTKIDIAREEATAGVVLFSYDWAVGDGYDGQGPTLLEVVGRTKFGGGRP